MVGVAVVGEGVEWHEALDEEIGKFHEESEFGHADDEAVEVFADAVLHEFYFFPFHQTALGFVGTALGLAGFVGDGVEFFESDWTAERLARALMRGMVATLGPRRRGSAGIPPARLRTERPQIVSR